MKLGSIAKGTRRIEVDVPDSDEKVGVVYRPAVLTSNNIARMTDRSTSELETRGMLSELLESWEIEDDETGEPLGTDPESLGKVPLEFIGHVLETILTKGGTVPEAKGGA